jgi:hypothetical protein
MYTISSTLYQVDIDIGIRIYTQTFTGFGPKFYILANDIIITHKNNLDPSTSLTYYKASSTISYLLQSSHC